MLDDYFVNNGSVQGDPPGQQLHFDDSDSVVPLSAALWLCRSQLGRICIAPWQHETPKINVNKSKSPTNLVSGHPVEVV